MPINNDNDNNDENEEADNNDEDRDRQEIDDEKKGKSMMMRYQQLQQVQLEFKIKVKMMKSQLFLPVQLEMTSSQELVNLYPFLSLLEDESEGKPQKNLILPHWLGQGQDSKIISNKIFVQDKKNNVM